MTPYRCTGCVFLVTSILGCHPLMAPESVGEMPNIEESATDLQHLTAKATAAGEAAAQIFAFAGASISTMSELDDMLAGFGTAAGCPHIELGDPGLPMDITFDYGSGCTVATPPEIRLSGTLTGRLFGANSFSLATENLTHLDQTLSGSITGGLSASAPVTTYQFTVNLASGDWPFVSGGGVLQRDAETNTMRVTQASLALRNAVDESFAVELTGVLLGILEDGRISPTSGSASVLVQAQSDGEPRSFKVDFSDDSGS